MQNLSIRFVGKAQIAAVQAAVRAGERLLVRFRQVEQAEDLVAGCHAVHRDVEKGAELPHRDEEICCQHDDEQCARKRHIVRAELHCRENHAQRRAAIGDQIHDGDGVELHGQHLHGDLAELFGLFVHFVVPGRICLIVFSVVRP